VREIVTTCDGATWGCEIRISADQSRCCAQQVPRRRLLRILVAGRDGQFQLALRNVPTANDVGAPTEVMGSGSG
jgi:hypothetical protein